MSPGSDDGYVPDDGDIVRLDFDPQAGREQAGSRPALVLSPASYNRISRLCIVCPVTNQSKGYPFEVPLPAGLGVTGVVLADQVNSLSWPARRASRLATCPPEVLAHAKAMVKALLRL